MTGDTLLEIRDLTTRYDVGKRSVRALDGVSFTIARGETLGIVGESGSGKSTMARSLIGLVPPPGRITSGDVVFEGKNVLSMKQSEIRRLRGNQIGFVPQDPLSSLNPLIRIGEQVAEGLRIHRGLSRKAAEERVIDLLERVDIVDPGQRMRDYPHQLSGGMRQRVAIAIAIACEPKLLIADEPTSALDVTTQAQVLGIMKRLSAELGMSMVLITHDFRVAAKMCDSIAVMYAGRIVEAGPSKFVFGAPQMPYTRALLQAMPTVEAHTPRERLQVIPGLPPDLAELRDGCRFASRCAYAKDECLAHEPSLTRRENGQDARCWATEPGGWLE
ncbi:ABC transporter ATP-binding protein [Parafrigoribacterium humi]|uniref:ABC transporter ATP-binding protein n=1 Tax=Parafrigoribacterium humi TaxID=3144664 RepID=UPI0032EB37AD